MKGMEGCGNEERLVGTGWQLCSKSSQHLPRLRLALADPKRVWRGGCGAAQPFLAAQPGYAAAKLALTCPCTSRKM